MRKLGLPQVVGAILTGLLLGPFLLRDHAIITTSTELKVIAEIGVILIMFSAGLDTNLKEIKQNGLPSVVITLLGVIVPLGLGFLVAGLFFGFGTYLEEPFRRRYFDGNVRRYHGRSAQGDGKT